jgi:hypothetical protein
MKEYCKKSLDHYHNKRDECENYAKKLSELERKKNILKNSVAELDKFCREEKGVNPDESSGLEYAVHELERQVAQKKKALEEASAVLWKTEQALSRYKLFFYRVNKIEIVKCYVLFQYYLQFCT